MSTHDHEQFFTCDECGRHLPADDASYQSRSGWQICNECEEPDYQGLAEGNYDTRWVKRVERHYK